MEPNQALQEGQTFLRNGQDMAERSPVNADALYMWDNQVQAIETYLANTETMAGEHDDLAKLRDELRTVKRNIETKVLEFELKADGEELPPDPTPEEQLEELKMYAEDVQELLEVLEKAKVGTLDELRELDEPRMQLDNFLVETEPFVGEDGDLDQVRQRARDVKQSLDGSAKELIQAVNAAEGE